MGLERGAVAKRWACERVALMSPPILLPTPFGFSHSCAHQLHVNPPQPNLPAAGASHFSPVSCLRDFSREKVLSSTHHQHGSMVEKQEVV